MHEITLMSRGPDGIRVSQSKTKWLNRLRESNERWKRGRLLHDFRHEFSAPVTGITSSTQVGRLSGSHSDIGFLLAQFPGQNGDGTER